MKNRLFPELDWWHASYWPKSHTVAQAPLKFDLAHHHANENTRHA